MSVYSDCEACLGPNRPTTQQHAVQASSPTTQQHAVQTSSPTTEQHAVQASKSLLNSCVWFCGLTLAGSQCNLRGGHNATACKTAGPMQHALAGSHRCVGGYLCVSLVRVHACACVCRPHATYAGRQPQVCRGATYVFYLSVKWVHVVVRMCVRVCVCSKKKLIKCVCLCISVRTYGCALVRVHACACICGYFCPWRCDALPT